MQGQTVNILGLADHRVINATTQLYNSRVRPALDKVNKKVYSHKT